MDVIGDRRQRGIPKLRDILRRQRRESEVNLITHKDQLLEISLTCIIVYQGQIDTPEIDFEYCDSDKPSAEMAGGC